MGRVRLQTIVVSSFFLLLLPIAHAQLTPTVTTLSTPSSSVYGQQVTLTASVSATTASGSVAFYDGGIWLGTRAVSGGSAQLATLSLHPSHALLRARYLGDTQFAPSQSTLVSMPVVAAAISGWSPATAYQYPGEAGNPVIADLNNDGAPDAVIVSNVLQVFLNDGLGHFTALPTVPLTEGNYAAAIADLNGDGKPDLVFGSLYKPFQVYLGVGDGTFTPGATFDGGSTGIFITDLNLDGVPDIVLSSGLTLLGVGDGTFRPSVTVSQYPVAVGDVNNDGIPDILVLYLRSFQTLLGNGDGTFQSPLPLTLPSQPLSALVGDFDNDGNLDVLLIGDDQTVLTGTGDGTFRLANACISASKIFSGFLSDLNEDGSLDSILIPYSGLAITALGPLNQPLGPNQSGCRPPGPPLGAGSINPGATYLSNVVPAVLSGNGATDIVYSSYTFNVARGIPTIAVALQTSANNTLYGSPLTLTATIGDPSKSGFVAFYDGVNIIGQATVVNGVATVVLTGLSPSTHSLTARFFGTGYSGLGTSVSTTVRVAPKPSSGFVALGVLQTGGLPSAVVTADFNRDGYDDFAVTNTLDNSVSILLGSATGLYNTSSFPTDAGPLAIVAADFNRDGVPDLAIANANSFTVDVFIGVGDGTFIRKPTLYSAPVNVDALLASDFNNDGIIDLVAGGLAGLQCIYTGNGDGTFQDPQQYNIGGVVYGLAAGDFSLTGVPGLADVQNISGQGYLAVEVLNNSKITPSPCNFGLLNPVGVAVDDFNSDGLPDIAAAIYGDFNTGQGGGAGIFLGSRPTTGTSCGEGSYAQYPAGTAPINVVAGDFNGDGYEDLLLSNFEGLSYLQGNGNGTFQPPITYSTLSAYGVAVGDFNKDGVVDVAITNALDDNLELFLGVPVPCTFRLSQGFLAADKNGGSFTLGVISNGASCAWTASSSGSFIQLIGTGGLGSGSVQVVLPPNQSGSELIGTIQIAGLTVPVTEWTTTQVFADVPPSDYYFDAVNLLKAKGITSGCTATNYCPTLLLTRSQMAVFIVRAVLGGDNFTYSPTPYFSDVQPTDFGFAWIQKLYELGITTGCAVTLYCPNDTVIRSQMAVFIIRARYGAHTVFDFPLTPYFTDEPASAFAFNFVQRMKEDNITSGCSATDYCPNGPVTRGDMAIFIMRGAFNQLLPSMEPILVSVSPNTIADGTTETLTIIGQNTHFVAGSSVLNAVPGLIVNSTMVLDSNTVQANVTANASTTPLPLSIWIQDQTEEAVLPNGLTAQ